MLSPSLIFSAVPWWGDLELVERLGPEDETKQASLDWTGAESCQRVRSNGVEELCGDEIMKHLECRLKNFGGNIPWCEEPEASLFITKHKDIYSYKEMDD